MDFLKQLFTPLDKKYCIYFYYISVLSFCFFILILLTTTWCLAFETKKINFIFCMNSVSLLISTFFRKFCQSFNVFYVF